MDARELLTSLEGRDLTTITGAWNEILAVRSDAVVVATSKSPNGQEVPIDLVQSAVDSLDATGEVEVSVDSVGYRSAFIGAVLKEIPGATVHKGPQRVRLGPS